MFLVANDTTNMSFVEYDTPYCYKLFKKHATIFLNILLIYLILCIGITYTTGQKYGIFWSPMETLVFDILICWKWLGTNHNQVLSR